MRYCGSVPTLVSVLKGVGATNVLMATVCKTLGAILGQAEAHRSIRKQDSCLWRKDAHLADSVSRCWFSLISPNKRSL